MSTKLVIFISVIFMLRVMRGPRAVLSTKLEAVLKLRKQLNENKDLCLREVIERCVFIHIRKLD